MDDISVKGNKKIFYAAIPMIISDDWLGKTTFSCCGETEVGVFTKKLIALAKMVMRRQGQHNCFCKIEKLMSEGCSCGGR